MDEQLIWRVWEAIRMPLDGHCKKCPPRIDTPYGEAIQGCRLHAQDLIEIVQHSKSGDGNG